MFGKSNKAKETLTMDRLEKLVEKLTVKNENTELQAKVESLVSLLNRLEMKFNSFVREKGNLDESFTLFVGSQNQQHEEIRRELEKLKKSKRRK